jgi:CTP:phosphocholine cytidylyltransferase-like protein
MKNNDYDLKQAMLLIQNNIDTIEICFEYLKEIFKELRDKIENNK